MKKSLMIALTLTDVSFLLYWALSTLVLLGVFSIPLEYLYADYDNPLVVAWNWSFLGIDLLFSILGLTAIKLAKVHNPLWRPICILSLAFTIAAGGMAISYWSILVEYNWSWYLPNLLLFIWPWYFLPELVRDTASRQGSD